MISIRVKVRVRFVVRVMVKVRVKVRDKLAGRPNKLEVGGPGRPNKPRYKTGHENEMPYIRHKPR
jgi:hypothetical protein